MSPVLDIREVIRTFRTHSPLMAYEITGGRQTDGTWNGTASVTRRVQATVFAARLQELEILAPGEASNGGIMIETEEKLWFTDPENAGVENKQTFVTYEGRTYRVLGTGMMKPLAGFNLYIALTYLSGGVASLPS